MYGQADRRISVCGKVGKIKNIAYKKSNVNNTNFVRILTNRNETAECYSENSFIKLFLSSFPLLAVFLRQFPRSSILPKSNANTEQSTTAKTKQSITFMTADIKSIPGIILLVRRIAM